MKILKRALLSIGLAVSVFVVVPATPASAGPCDTAPVGSSCERLWIGVCQLAGGHHSDCVIAVLT